MAIKAEREQAGGPGVLALLPADSVTEHSIDTPAGKLAYTATAGTFSLFDQSGERSAAVFYTAFVAKSNDHDAAGNVRVQRRTWRRLGVPRPRSGRSALAAFGSNYDGANVRLVDNPETWLAFTDLVLIDPVGTGWSGPPNPTAATTSGACTATLKSLAKVIALYVAKNSRVSSPKFILGESYGGFRAAKVARSAAKQSGHHGERHPDGLAADRRPVPVRRRPLRARRRVQIPSLAAAELERKGTFTTAALAQAEHFALTDYLSALAGPPLAGDAAHAFYARVAQMTGLPEDVVARERGFIRDTYVKSLHVADHKIVSQYDATFAVDDPNPESAVGARARSVSGRISFAPTAAPSSPMRAMNSVSRPK